MVKAYRDTWELGLPLKRKATLPKHGISPRSRQFPWHAGHAPCFSDTGGRIGISQKGEGLTMRNTVVRTATAGLIGFVLVGFAGIAAAQQPPATPGSEASPQMMTMMMQQQTQMTDSMRASDARLRELSAKMQAARGQAKVDTIAELLAAVVAEQSSMHAQMLQLHDSMMKQMMTNMPGMMDKMKQMQGERNPPAQETPKP
jgi:hypothetical protein